MSCGDITARNFRVVGTDVHHLDVDHDGIAYGEEIGLATGTGAHGVGRRFCWRRPPGSPSHGRRVEPRCSITGPFWDPRVADARSALDGPATQATQAPELAWISRGATTSGIFSVNSVASGSTRRGVDPP